MKPTNNDKQWTWVLQVESWLSNAGSPSKAGGTIWVLFDKKVICSEDRGFGHTQKLVWCGSDWGRC